MQIETDALVMVLDGRKMLMLRNHGDATYPNLKVETVQERDNPADRDQGTDRPGRVQSSAGTARSAMQEVDFHQQEEDRFAADAAALLRERALANDYESLIVVAPANTLGELRKHYHKEVERRLSGELTKDLASHPISEIEKILLAN
jgi:protein required for attachment to host cells